MTPEQLELKELLDSAPAAWVDLTPEQQALLSQTLRPDGEFTAEQRELLKDRWLLVTETKLAEMISDLSPGIGLHAVADLEQNLWLSADLLTDCLRPTDTYYEIGADLIYLPITLKSASDFPQPSNTL